MLPRFTCSIGRTLPIAARGQPIPCLHPRPGVFSDAVLIDLRLTRRRTLRTHRTRRERSRPCTARRPRCSGSCGGLSTSSSALCRCATPSVSCPETAAPTASFPADRLGTSKRSEGGLRDARLYANCGRVVARYRRPSRAERRWDTETEARWRTDERRRGEKRVRQISSSGGREPSRWARPLAVLRVQRPAAVPAVAVQ